MRLIETDSLTNQNLSSALEVGSYTADATRAIYAMVFATQVAGNGDYVAYLTINRAGAGTTYRVIPITTAAAASGVTSICLTTVTIPVQSGDVVKALLTGLAGDTTTPDTIVDWYEDDYGTATSLALVKADTAAILDDTGTAGVVVAAASKTGYALSSASIQAIWDALTSALTTVGSIGKRLADNVDVVLSTRSTVTTAQVNTEVDTALADVGLTTTITGRIDAAVSTRASAADMATALGYIDTEIAAILDDTGTSGVALGASTINSIADGVLDRSITEPSAVFTWPASLRGIIRFIGALARNKITQTNTTQTLRNDADNAAIGTSTVSSDGTTTTRGEFS